MWEWRAGVVIETGEPVMAMGGFHGLDPIVTPEKLAQLVTTNPVRFVMQGDLSLIDRTMGAVSAGKAVNDWMRANGTLVDPALWWPGISTASTRGLELYDLRPGDGIVPIRRH